MCRHESRGLCIYHNATGSPKKVNRQYPRIDDKADLPREDVLGVIIPQRHLGGSPVRDSSRLKVHHLCQLRLCIKVISLTLSSNHHDHKNNNHERKALVLPATKPLRPQTRSQEENNIPVITSTHTGELPVNSAISFTSGK